RRAERIAGYLERARKELADNDFAGARRYAERALEVEERQDIRDELTRIDKAEEAYKKEQARLKAEEEARKERERIAREKAEAEREAARRAERIAGYLERARKELADNDFAGARRYAERASDVGETKEVKTFLQEIDEAELSYEKEQARIKAEKEQREKEEQVASLVNRAREELADNDFDTAREYARQAMEIKETQTASDILDNIEKTEKAYWQEQARKKAEEEAKRERERIERERAIEEQEKQRKKNKIAEYLEQARERLQDNKFKDAINYVRDALAIEETAEAQTLLSEIDQTRIEYEKQQELLEQQAELQKQAELAEKQRKEEEAQRKREEAKIQKYLDIAKKSFEREDYGSARRYAYMAHDVNPNSTEVADMITRIDKAEMFGDWEERREDMKKAAQKAVQRVEEKGDPFHIYDEEKTWYQYVAELFEKKTEEMTRVEEGKKYSIDECVQIALNRSQRKIVYDKQVKLAEMRVWEARRDLFPNVTVKTELGSGKVQGDGMLRHYKAQKYQIEVKHTAFDGFGSWFKLRQQQANLVTTKLERQKITNEIIFDTKRAYYSLDKALKNLKLQEAHKTRVNNFYSIMEQAYQEELVSHMDYLNVKGLNLQTNFSYISAGEDVDLAELVLFQAMNLEPEQHIKIKAVPKPTELLSIGLENCYTLAFANNPEYRVKVNAIKYFDFQRKMMKAEGWPKIDFHGSFGAAYELYEPMNHPNDLKSQIAGQPRRKDRSWEPEWFAGAKGTIPVWGSTFEYNYVREMWAPTVSQFRGSQTATSYFTFKFLDDLAYFSNIEEARAGFERAKYEQLKAEKDLIVQVKEAYFGYRKALLQMELAEAKYEHQKMYVDVLVERFRFGEFDMPRLIEEYEKFTEMEYGMLSSYSDYYTALLSVNKAIGIPSFFRDEHEDIDYMQWKKHEEERTEKQIQALREQEARDREQEINEYLKKAQRELDNNDFEGARKYAQVAFEVQKDNSQVNEFLSKIDEKETTYKEEQERLKAEEEARKERERIAREKAEAEREAARRAERIEGYLERARKELADNDFAGARRYAERALEVEERQDIRDELTRIDKAEEAYKKEQARLKAEEEARKERERIAR
ncbi:MAG: hypothetical protein GF409_05160, partial [Candidatus Omnitrophica bacterium]|nr:hypothetical protein [Candidatus Omnitrophota bacterium]